MIGQFNRGQQFRSKQEVAIFETNSPTKEAETGLFISKDQIWEVDGYNEDADWYILICRKSGIALRMTLDDINSLFEGVAE